MSKNAIDTLVAYCAGAIGGLVRWFTFPRSWTLNIFNSLHDAIEAAARLVEASLIAFCCGVAGVIGKKIIEYINQKKKPYK